MYINTMYKQWHISGVGNLKACTSATAHTQNRYFFCIFKL